MENIKNKMNKKGSFKQLALIFILSGIFAFAFFNYMIGFANDNEVSVSITDEKIINDSFNNIQGNLSLYPSTVDSSAGSFYNQTTTTKDDTGFEIPGIKTITQSLILVPRAIFITTGNLIYVYIFGGDEEGSNFNIVFNVIISIFIVLAIIYAIKLLRSGDPD